MRSLFLAPLRALRWVGATLKTVWLMLGIMLLILVALELACRLYHTREAGSAPDSPNYFLKVDSYKGQPWIEGYYHEFIAAFNTDWRSYVYWRRKPVQGQYVNVDAQNHRRTWAPPADPAAKPLKVFMFGGSTMWGEGVRDDYTIPSHLAKLLAEHKIPAAITNFGETGYVSTQQVIELLRQLQQGNIPDLVIFYDGVNEVYAAFQAGVAGLPQNEWKRELEYNISNRYRKLRNLFFQNTLDRFCIGRSLKNMAQRLHGAQAPVKSWDGLEKPILEVYRTNVKAVQALGLTYGFPTLFYWQPVIYFKDHLTEFEKNFTHDAEMKVLYHRTYGLLRDQQARGEDKMIHDISTIFGPVREPLFVDYCHVNETGNGILARRMSQDVLPLLAGRCDGERCVMPGQ